MGSIEYHGKKVMKLNMTQLCTKHDDGLPLNRNEGGAMYALLSLEKYRNPPVPTGFLGVLHTMKHACYLDYA